MSDDGGQIDRRTEETPWQAGRLTGLRRSEGAQSRYFRIPRFSGNGDVARLTSRRLGVPPAVSATLRSGSNSGTLGSPIFALIHSEGCPPKRFARRWAPQSHFRVTVGKPRRRPLRSRRTCSIPSRPIAANPSNIFAVSVRDTADSHLRGDDLPSLSHQTGTVRRPRFSAALKSGRAPCCVNRRCRSRWAIPPIWDHHEGALRRLADVATCGYN